MRFRVDGTVATVDLHGVYQRDAIDLLTGWLNQAPPQVAELRVIHGYHQGTEIRDMVREEYQNHPKVIRMETSHPGETDLVLREF